MAMPSQPLLSPDTGSDETASARLAARVMAAPGWCREVGGNLMAARPTRRRSTAKYKQRILDETDRATGTGAVSSILRRRSRAS